MRVRKEFPFDNPADLLERILDRGIVVSPVSRLEVVERGLHGMKLVIDANEVDGVRRAA